MTESGTTLRRLGEGVADSDALAQLRSWIDQARASEEPWAEVITLATCGREGRPSARAVVLRDLDESGLAFDSDYQSRKAEELRANPWAAAVFLWPARQRQVRVEGRVEPARAEESDARFAAAPREQRLAIWASPQSRVVTDPGQLEARRSRLEASYAGQEVPRPSRWGGYRLVPAAMEFWQARSDRLHDRLEYRRRPDGGWQVERLSP